MLKTRLTLAPGANGTKKLVELLYLVQIDWQETALREKAKSLGARWDAARRLWMMPRATVRALSAEDRIRAWLEPE